jgi:hypothetical protein
MSNDTKFKPGHLSRGGRRKGSRDRIATALLEEIAKDFEAHGAEAVKIARMERPVEYLRVVASLLPKEFEITTQNITNTLSDEELENLIEHARQQRAELAASRDDAAGGTKATTH